MPNYIDRTGERFGTLTITRRRPNKGRRVVVEAICDCGQLVEREIASLVTAGRLGIISKCDFCRAESQIAEMLGKQFGWLHVEERGEDRILPSGGREIQYWCRCACGHRVLVPGHSLRNGHTRSCGCLNKPDLSGQRRGELDVIEFDPTRQRWKCRCTCQEHTIVWRTTSQLNSKKRGSRDCGCSGAAALKARWAAKRDPLAIGLRLIYQDCKNAAKKREIEFLLTKENAYPLFTQCCFYCGYPPMSTKRPYYQTKPGVLTYLDPPLAYNGLDRVDNTDGYRKENVVTCCLTCNRAKNNMTVAEFISWLRRISGNSEAILRLERLLEERVQSSHSQSWLPPSPLAGTTP